MDDALSTIHTASEEETMAAGLALAGHLSGVVLLEGELGAGKTTLVRGIVSGIEGANSEEVSSPTFTLIHDYGAGVFHIDLYRLEGEREIEALGLDEIFENGRLILVEWGSKLGMLTPECYTTIQIESKDQQERVLHIKENSRDSASH